MFGARAIKQWIQNLSAGGLLTHEHFYATPRKLQLIKESGIDHILVHIRNPLDALFSEWRYLTKPGMEDVLKYILRLNNDPFSFSEIINQDNGLRRFSSFYWPFLSEFIFSWKKSKAILIQIKNPCNTI